MKNRHMMVPTRAVFRCELGLDLLRNHLARGGLGYAEIAMQKEITQTF
jgi:hypothetical protein